ncbi:MAG: IS66 family transposase zinc-finger binding domain-containing protein, partial [Burkholderiales bacterium]
MVNTQAFEQMNTQQLRDVVLGLMGAIKQNETVIADKDQIIVARDRELLYRKTKIDQLTQELALHRRWKFGRSSEQLSGEQSSLLDETLDADIAAMEAELAALAPSNSDTDRKSDRKQKPKRALFPDNLPRTEFHHEPDSTTCKCGCELKRIGEDVSEKLDYEPGIISVERHIRGKWACAHCQTIT